MNYSYINLDNKKNLIEGVILKKLQVHNDESGSLVETLRQDWDDVYNDGERSFFMQYISKTPSGLARDEDQWHIHKNQEDRFICVNGKIVTAIFDPRENSKTKGKLNLFVMSPEKEDEMYMVIIPKNTYHGFMVVSKEKGYLLNFPTQVYNPKDEGRVKNTQFSWQKVREDFNLK